MTATPKRILILLSDTGGGHRAAAQAIQEAIAYLYPDRFQISTVDAWRDYTPWPINRIPAAYPWLTGPGLPLWRLLWRCGQSEKSLAAVAWLGAVVVNRRFQLLIQETRPDLVVSVHPLINHVPLRIVRGMGLRIPFLTVVTDLVTVPPVWFCPEVDFCAVPTEPARLIALKAGLAPERLEVVGQPVSLQFARGIGRKRDLRAKLGLDPDRPVVLLVGGGEGYGPLFDIARVVARCGTDLQLLVVSGRNKALRSHLEAVEWAVQTRIFGFVNNMPDLMGAADILISKAGPGTISEAFIAGLPLILFGYIPGQEDGNLQYVREHGAGAYLENPQDIGLLVAEWLKPNGTGLKEMAARAAALAKPEASLTIARRIVAFFDM